MCTAAVARDCAAQCAHACLAGHVKPSAHCAASKHLHDDVPQVREPEGHPVLCCGLAQAIVVVIILRGRGMGVGGCARARQQLATPCRVLTAFSRLCASLLSGGLLSGGLALATRGSVGVRATVAAGGTGATWLPAGLLMALGLPSPLTRAVNAGDYLQSRKQ